MRYTAAIAIALVTLANPELAGAQPYPAKPITLVVPFPAGGPSDQLARVVAGPLSGLLGQQIVIENRAGGGGLIGLSTVQKSAPDGYTLLLAREGIRVPDDLVPVALLATQPVVLATRGKDLTTVAKFLEAARSKGVKYSAAGLGSAGHSVGELCRSSASISSDKMTFVPMSNIAEATAALKGGSIDAIFEPLSSLNHLFGMGDVQPVAVAAPDRLPALREVPTTAEAGLANCSATIWFALLAPKGTPANIIERLHDEVTKQVLTRQEVKDVMSKSGMVVASMPLESARAIIQVPPACCRSETPCPPGTDCSK
jgi:tripartite-type tricarboxylate transporter receptor subunit TctC